MEKQFKLLHKMLISFIQKNRRIIFFVLVAAFVLPDVSVYFDSTSRKTDIMGYIAAGNDALNSQPLYKNTANTWPPFFSVVMIPLSVVHNIFGLGVTKEIWYLINFAALIGAIKIIVFIHYGKRPTFFKSSTFDFTSDLVFVPVLLVLPAIVKNFFWLQINALLLILISTGLLMHLRKKYLLAGLLFGIAGALKAFPGLFAIYFLLKKQWKTFISTMAFGIFFTASPTLLYGFEGFINLLIKWFRLSFSEPLIIGYTSFDNQSFYAFWERLLAHQLLLTQPGSVLICLANLTSIIITFTAAFIIIIRSPVRNNPVTSCIEISIICILMILFSPVAWEHYWLLLLPAAVSIYYCIRKIPDINTPLIKTLFTIWMLLTQISYLFPRTIVQSFLKSHSNSTIAAMIVLFILLILHSRIKTAYLEEISAITAKSSRSTIRS